MGYIFIASDWPRELSQEQIHSKLFLLREKRTVYSSDIQFHTPIYTGEYREKNENREMGVISELVKSKVQR